MATFNAPIAGQSLTGQPKGHPWERPPEISDPEEAIQMHLTRLSEPDLLQSLFSILDDDEIDIATLTKGILRGSVAKGIHSLDVSLIIAPVIHEYIKQAAKFAGITAEDGFEDKSAKEQQRQSSIASKARKQLKAMSISPKEDVQEVVAATEEVVAPKGLMARGNM